MDLSLDDIIQQKRFKVGGGRGRSRGGFGGRGRGRGRADNNLRRVRRDGVPRNSGGLARVLPDKWQHDLFQSGRTNKGGLTTGGSANRIHISNLDFGVNNDDIHELFLEFGAIRKATVHYDKSGRSLGTAEVIYANSSSAIKAKNHYNAVPLDGRPMIIQLVGAVAVSNGQTNRPRVNKGRVFVGRRVAGARGRSAFGRPRRGRGGFPPKPSVTKDELDQQLASYNAQRG